jgi:hypothetical protein
MELQGELLVDPVVKALEVPVLRVGLLVDVIRKERLDNFLNHLFKIRPQPIARQHLFPLFINHLALAVHDVAKSRRCFRMSKFWPRPASGRSRWPGDQTVFDRFVLFDPDTVHDGGDFFRPEDA